MLPSEQGRQVLVAHSCGGIILTESGFRSAGFGPCLRRRLAPDGGEDYAARAGSVIPTPPASPA